MIDTSFYVLLSILALGFLIFIHELGHYYAARWMGMKVDAFGIGFGKAIYSWTRDGVEWRLNWLPFGGYVKIAGMELSKDEDPDKVPGGFYSKTPLQRIFVSFAGPFVNLAFALLVFTVIWMAGGREKPFSQLTNVVGWVDPKSELFAEGVRPGDEVLSYNGHAFRGVADHMTGPMMAGDSLTVEGISQKGGKPFEFTIKPYPHPAALQQGLMTSGILQPASFVITGDLSSKVGPGGIQKGDRIVWINGEKIYSMYQLRGALNSDRVLLTVKRGDKLLQRRVPRVSVNELLLNTETREELTDWQFDAKLSGKKLRTLTFLPYNLDHDGIIEGRIPVVDQELEVEFFPKVVAGATDEPLQAGDRIVAISGSKIANSSELFSKLQTQMANVIVKRGTEQEKVLSLQEEQAHFLKAFENPDLQKLIQSVGSNESLHQLGSYVLLGPIEPKTQQALHQNTPESKTAYLSQLVEKQKEIEAIENPEMREKALAQFHQSQEQLYLGISVTDAQARYNPGPFQQFGDLTKEIYRSLKALFTGTLSPKWLSGPPGIVQAVQSSLKVSYVEALFWLGLISLNLGYLNLLPIPVLDGGYICIFLFEMVSKKRVRPEYLEKLILPFVLILIGFLIYASYNDLIRILGT